MSYEHCPHHHHIDRKSDFKKLSLVILLIFLYMIAEIIGGLYSNSMALLADAGHMFSDTVALIISYFALYITSKPATAAKTYGFYRSEILAAFINSILLVIIALFILYEAIERLMDPPQIKAIFMIWIATGGLIVNIIAALMLHQSGKHNINIRGAFLHVIGDLLGSIGAIVAGLLIIKFNWYIADPIISILIAVLILFGAYNLLCESTNILLEGTPSHVNIAQINKLIKEIDGVEDVYDLHIWAITSDKIALSAHVVSDEPCKNILEDVTKLIHHEFKILHTTIQVEPTGFKEAECSFSHND